MRKLTTFFKLRISFIGLFLLFSNQLLADGSKDLYPDGKLGYRAFLRSSPTVDAERWPFPTQGTHFVYAKVGERITLASSAQLATGPSAIKLYSPSGGLLLNDATIAGQISNRVAELAGPQLSGQTGGNRYTPIYYQVPTGATGIYRVEFIGRTTGDPGTTILANASWTQGDNGIPSWDVSVINTANTAFIKGRVYTNVLNLSNGNTSSNANGFRGIVYALTDDGFTYRINNNGNNGLYFTFFVNNNGFLGAGGVPLYKSLNKSNLSNSDVQNPLNADTPTHVTHKIFYNLPAGDLPLTSIGAVPGNSTWLKKAPVVPVVTGLTFQGVEGVEGQVSNKGGYVKFTSNRDGKYNINIKSSENPEAFPARVLIGFAATGDNSIYWDGKDGSGNLLPAGIEPVATTVKLQGAEVHFPYIDMEYNQFGTVIELLDDTNLNNVVSDIVYWNDIDIPDVTNGTNSNPKNNSQLPPTSSAGISSNTNGHIWGVGGTGTAGQFGDKKSMDTWAFVTGPSVTLPTNIETKIADLKISHVIASKAAVVPGDILNFSIKVKNDGPSSVEGAQFKFVLPLGFNPQSLSFIGNGCGTESLAITYNSATRTYSSSLDLPNGCEITYNFATLVTSAVTPGNQDFNASILRPNDVTDPDATNSDLNVPPTNAAFECANNGLGGVCNNIKVLQVLFSQTEICTEQVLGETFTAEGGVPKVFNQPATNYGFVFDIYKLDNSFNMNINGVNLASSELEFQQESTPAPGINIRFLDGTTYGTGGVTGTQKIWQMTGTSAAPLIKVVISPTGTVTMFGSKVSGGLLFPLELINGNVFNTILWNANSPNVITITQNVVGTTNITGRGYGLKIVPCACYNPANTTGIGPDTKLGITLLQRAGIEDADQWPMVRKSGHIALESNTKGFVITRVAKADLGGITTPQEGMMLYDTTDKCLKIYADGVWACFSQPACP
ncbi:DUF11 domain-containing protein [Kaistella antarctica]|uniref:DUF11 domain-containing protein n=1 Tax=Kaistella antarctica TaxID=266748 RepID=A0A3S5EUR7_9FLAO|nr:DUF11 domain-containing protein [Kaistella antarctica]SEW12451.1 conserved repeat domain-containing protein [Kaistella antarctica]VEH99033.1 Uncharacterised protein [Kaistella antarctica]